MNKAMIFLLSALTTLPAFSSEIQPYVVGNTGKGSISRNASTVSLESFSSMLSDTLSEGDIVQDLTTNQTQRVQKPCHQCCAYLLSFICKSRCCKNKRIETTSSTSSPVIVNWADPVQGQNLRAVHMFRSNTRPMIKSTSHTSDIRTDSRTGSINPLATSNSFNGHVPLESKLADYGSLSEPPSPQPVHFGRQTSAPARRGSEAIKSGQLERSPSVVINIGSSTFDDSDTLGIPTSSSYSEHDDPDALQIRSRAHSRASETSIRGDEHDDQPRTSRTQSSASISSLP